MINEWIRLLNLNGDDPPWEGEPREIRATVRLGKYAFRVKVVDFLQENRLAVSVYPIDSFEGLDKENIGPIKILVEVDLLSEITLLY